MFKGRARLGDVFFDAIISEGHESGMAVTEHPVEEGINVTDHVRQLPEKLTLDALFTNTPLSLEELQVRGPPAAGGGFARQQMEELRRLMAAGTLMTLTLPWRTVENLVIERISNSVDKTITDALRCTLSLKEIRIVKSEQVKLEQQVRSTKIGTKPNGTNNKGKQPNPPPATPEERTSMLDDLSGLGTVLKR